MLTTFFTSFRKRFTFISVFRSIFNSVLLLSNLTCDHSRWRIFQFVYATSFRCQSCILSCTDFRSFLYYLSSARMCDNLAVMLFPTPKYSPRMQCCHFLIMLFCLHVLSVYAERCQGFVEFQPRLGLVRRSVLLFCRMFSVTLCYFLVPCFIRRQFFCWLFCNISRTTWTVRGFIVTYLLTLYSSVTVTVSHWLLWSYWWCVKFAFTINWQCVLHYVSNSIPKNDFCWSYS